jgi:hypothetical protein
VKVASYERDEISVDNLQVQRQQRATSSVMCSMTRDIFACTLRLPWLPDDISQESSTSAASIYTSMIIGYIATCASFDEYDG